MIRVCLSGIGKTGQEVAKFVLEQKNIALVSAICSDLSTKKGKDLGEIIGGKSTGIIVEGSDKLEEVVDRTKPDVVLDFSNPTATIRNAKIFSKHRVNVVVGTTGFSETDLKKLIHLTGKYNNGIIYAPNITTGVNVMMLIANLTANILNNYDFQITEIHHKNKKDSPSGTAIKIANEIKKGLKSSGKVSEDIPITSIRAGGVVGKHQCLIIGEEDKIEISHESFSRRAFAQGALRAVEFIVGKKGYFEMADVLNLEKALNDYLKKDHKRFNKIYLKQSETLVAEG